MAIQSACFYEKCLSCDLPQLQSVNKLLDIVRAMTRGPASSLCPGSSRSEPVTLDGRYLDGELDGELLAGCLVIGPPQQRGSSSS